VKQHNEPVATDTAFSNTPAFHSGVTAAQIFVGMESLVADVYGLKTDKECVNTLADNIRKWGAMDKHVTVPNRRIAIASSRFFVLYASVLGLMSLIMKTRTLQISIWYTQSCNQIQNELFWCPIKHMAACLDVCLHIVESPCKRSTRMENTTTSPNWTNTRNFEVPPFLILLTSILPLVF
jgi:hypothetical protein